MFLDFKGRKRKIFYGIKRVKCNEVVREVFDAYD